METMIHPPRTGMDAFKMMPEGTYCQLINDILIMSPAPPFSHQDLRGKIHGAILWKIQNKNMGVVAFAPVDVYLNSRNAYQPDIIYISEERKNIIIERGIIGVPDLVIKILSAGNANYDRGQKKMFMKKPGLKNIG